MSWGKVADSAAGTTSSSLTAAPETRGERKTRNARKEKVRKEKVTETRAAKREQPFQIMFRSQNQLVRACHLALYVWLLLQGLRVTC